MTNASESQKTGVSLAGAWRLSAGRAMSLSPKAVSVLRVRRGAVWVTLGEPSGLSPQTAGDLVLKDGEFIVVPAGARLVMQSLAPAHDDDRVFFDWMDARVPQTQSSRFSREVRMPLKDLGVALLQVGAALLKVLRGLLGYSELLVAGRGRVVSPLESMRS